MRYFCLGVDDEVGSSTFNTFFDSVAVSQSYIGTGSSNPNPTPTPTPNPTATPTPTPSPTPTPTTSPTPSPTPSPTSTPRPTATPSPTPPPTSTPTYKEAATTLQFQASAIASDGTVYAGAGNTLYKSQDNGQTWTPLLTFDASSSTPAGINCVYVSSLGYIFVVPDTSAATNLLGLWRSTDDGATWKRVMAEPIYCTTLSPLAEDSNGNLFFGVYTVGSYAANASICRSTDGGAHWTTVYYDSSGRHVHCVAVDPANNYVYASVGDVNVWNGLTGQNFNTEYVIRSTQDGNSGTFTKIFNGAPEMLGIDTIDATLSDGTLVPVARILAQTISTVNFIEQPMTSTSTSFSTQATNPTLSGYEPTTSTGTYTQAS